jgi:uncharacterized protein YvpB
MRLFPVLAPLLLVSCADSSLLRHGRHADDQPSTRSAQTGDSTVVHQPTFYLLSDDPCTDPCTFRASTNLDVARVRYEADGWEIGESGDQASGWALEYDFQVQGDRYVKAVALDPSGNEILAAGAMIEVVGDDDQGSGSSGGADSGLPDVPYFYQYDNSQNPSGSCQNTSAAMVLSWVGWSGDPDDLSSYWGTSYAQSPSGLAAMFNTEARWQGLPDRLQAHTSGSISGMRSLLDDGLPVIIHGYFTSYGHVVVVLGYDSQGYWVNDPAGTWNQQFMGGYPHGWEPSAGHAIHYERDSFEAAVATSNGSTYLPLWYHELH